MQDEALQQAEILIEMDESEKKGVFTLTTRGSLGGVGGLATATGFFLITTVGFGSVDSSAGFFGITFSSTTTGFGTGA